MCQNSGHYEKKCQLGGDSEILGGDSKKSGWGSVSKKVKNWVGIRGGGDKKKNLFGGDEKKGGSPRPHTVENPEGVHVLTQGEGCHLGPCCA